MAYINFPTAQQLLADPMKYGPYFTTPGRDGYSIYSRMKMRADMYGVQDAQGSLDNEQAQLNTAINRIEEEKYNILNAGYNVNDTSGYLQSDLINRLASLKKIQDSVAPELRGEVVPTYQQYISGTAKDPYGTQVVSSGGRIVTPSTFGQTPAAVTEPMVGMQKADGTTQFVPQSQVVAYESNGWSKVPDVGTQNPPPPGQSGSGNPPAAGTPGKVDVYKVGNSYYRADTGAKILTPAELTSYTSKGGVLVPAPSGAVEGGASNPPVSSAPPSNIQAATPQAPTPQVSDISKLANRYGETNDENLNFKASQMLDGFLTILQTKNSLGISPEVFANIKIKDPALMGKYIIALAYGGYSLEDIYKDIKRQDLALKGDATMNNLSIIDVAQNKDAYAASSAGKQAYSNPLLTMPSNLKGITNPSLFKLKMFQMPDAFFDELVPALDKDSAEFKQQMQDIKDAYHDVVASQLNATNERDKAVADYNYQQLVKQIQDTYGIKLSNSALEAWKQIETLGDSISTRGLTGSGISNELVDDYLRQVRDSDKITRSSKLTTEEQNLAAKIQASASPAEIKALNDEDAAKGLPQDQWRTVKWGLKPSATALAALDVNSLMSKYGITKEEAQKYHDSMIDENGNYRSTLYQKYTESLATNQAAKESAQADQLYNKNVAASTNAYADYLTRAPSELFSTVSSPSGSTSSVPGAEGASAVKTYDQANASSVGPSSPTSPNTADSSKAASDISKNLNNPPAPSESQKSPIKAATPPAGYKLIADPASLKNYTEKQIWRDPNSTKIYSATI